jgi:hypothetical protein
MKRGWLLGCILTLIVGVSSARAARLLHHDLRVSLSPQEQTLYGRDTLTVETAKESRLDFALAPQATLREVTVSGHKVDWHWDEGRLTVPLPADIGAQASVTVDYAIRFAARPPARPLNSEDPSYGVTATITAKGSFLGDDAGWYPRLPGALPTFRIEISLPAGQSAVTSGRLVAKRVENHRDVSIWETTTPLRSLALAAGPYRIGRASAGGIPVYTFFSEENQGFSASYLATASRDLKFYTKLLGPYPFAKFAVAENIFPTGYGFPSWTLLGGGLLRYPFILRISLGHEIAHSWWGNGVWVDDRGGNWSEGLTSFVADYLDRERASAAEGRNYRLKILRDYAALVTPAGEMPLTRFVSRSNPASQAIGYGKATMVFYMLRSRLGDELFWQGLREVVRERLFRKTSWDDIARILGRVGGDDLAPFFRQWVKRPGAPVLRLRDVALARQHGRWVVTGTLVQAPPFFNLRLPIELSGHGEHRTTVLASDGPATPFRLTSATRPTRLAVDPDATVFRRLSPQELPATVNELRGSSSLVAVIAAGLPEATAQGALRLLPALGHQGVPLLSEAEATPERLAGHDVLYLGWPQALSRRPVLPKDVSPRADGLELDGQRYRGAAIAAFCAFRPQHHPRRVAALFLPGSPNAATAAIYKIPHYGNDSYLVFEDGINRAKGTWPTTDSPLIDNFAGAPR